MFPFGGGDFMFTVVPFIAMVGFVFVVGFTIAIAIKGGMQWNKNNHSPVLTVNAKIVAKRMNVSEYSHFDSDNSHMHNSASTTYYATFEVESGDRMEFVIPSSEYGMLAENDVGRLTFQGTRYKGFERDRS